jgi:hypothetical protein
VGALQAAEKGIQKGKKRQGTTSVVPKKLFNRSRALAPEGYYPVETDDVATTKLLPQGLKAGSLLPAFMARDPEGTPVVP